MKQLNLTEGPILRNLLTLSMPIVLANFLQTSYNLIDMFWLGRLPNAEEAVAVNGLVFPIMFFFLSFGLGASVAGTSLISQYKGAQQNSMCQKVVGQFLYVISFFSVFFLLVGFFFIGDLLVWLNTPEEIVHSATGYMTLIVYSMPFMIIFLSYQSFAHGLGDTVTPLIIQIVSISINLILDPLLIFGWYGFPELGIDGAGYATIIARGAGVIAALYCLVIKNKEILPNWSDLAPNKVILKKIINIMLPASFGHSLTSFGFLFLQGFVNSYGTVVISVFSVGNKVTSLYMMPAMGISNGLASIVGQNLGAKKMDRVDATIDIAVKITLSFMLVGTIMLYFLGEHVTLFFIESGNQEVVNIGVRMFKTFSVATFMFAIFFVYMGVFNGAGYTRPSMYLNIARLWILRIPLVYILSGKILLISFWADSFLAPVLNVLSLPLKEYPYDALWWSMLISNIVTGGGAYIAYKKGKWRKGVI